MDQWVLASASPRRKELLERFGHGFIVMESHVDEGMDTHDASDMVTTLAKRKAACVAGQLPQGTLVIGADTVVVQQGKILGKPADQADARRMLQALEGGWHEVITGVCVMHSGTDKCIVKSETTRVQFGKMSSEQIDAYVATGEPLDKAGAYAIQGQGGLYIARIDGCYYNVVGLPLHLLREMLDALGKDTPL